MVACISTAKFVFLALLVVLANAVAQSAFHAAVVEYNPITQNSLGPVSRDVAVGVMKSNVVALEAFIAQAVESGAKIVVLPEYGLNGPVFRTRDEALVYLEPIPDPRSFPCANQTAAAESPISAMLSCMALKYKVVLVANYGDVQSCSSKSDPHCPMDGRYQFNTQVAFAESGVVLNKYWKEHLYYEFYFDTPIGQAPKFFDTSFGVRFGMMICFDIIFGYPALDLMLVHKLQHFVYSTWWVNTPPLMTATQIQQGWSEFFNVALLAANSGKFWYNSGSGLFVSGNALASRYNSEDRPSNFVLVESIPTNLSAVKVASSGLTVPHAYFRGLDLKYANFNESMLSGYHYFQLSVSGLSCRATVKVSQAADPASIGEMYFYAASGSLTPLFPSKACGVMRCPTKDLRKCFTLVPEMIPPSSAETAFEVLDLSAEFTSNNLPATAVVPMTATSNGQLLDPGSAQFSRVSSPGDSPSIFRLQIASTSTMSKVPIMNWTLFIRDLSSKNLGAMSETSKTSSGLNT